MKYFAALDVSDKETWVCVVDHEGTILKEGPVPTEPAAIVAFLHITQLKLEHVGFEAGPLSPWLYHELLAANVPVICLETRHANKVESLLDFIHHVIEIAVEKCEPEQ